MPLLTGREGFPDSWCFASSLNGYMSEALFVTWFKDIFLKHIGPERPVILLFDNHKSHLSVEVSQLAIENQVRSKYKTNII